MTSLAVSFDRELLVSGSFDRTVRRWRPSTGEAVGELLRGHNDWINYVAVSEHSNRIVSRSDDCNVRLWDILSGEAI